MSRGKWEGSSFFGLSAFWGGGVTIDRVFWSCKTSNATCEAVYFCFGGGVIAEASIDFFGKAKASKAYNSRNLIGWSTGWRGAFPVGKGSLSGTKTKGLHNEAVIEHGSGGIGEGGGIAKITCTTLSTTCE